VTVNRDSLDEEWRATAARPVADCNVQRGGQDEGAAKDLFTAANPLRLDVNQAPHQGPHFDLIDLDSRIDRWI